MKKQEKRSNLRPVLNSRSQLLETGLQGLKSTKAFTLVELIVVITILAILGTIAFISLQGYSKDARDSVRISDISKIKTSLELFQLDAGKYPETTEPTNITYSGAIAWTQGTFGTLTFNNVTKLDKIPLDPVTDRQYVYSVTNTKQEYQIAGIMEGDEVSISSPLPLGEGLGVRANATQKTAMVKISGNYNGKLLKVSTGATDYVLAVPSIITSSGTTVDQIISSKFLAYNGYKNLPAQYAGSSYEVLGEDEINFVNSDDLVIYSGDLKTLSSTELAGKTARKNLIEKLKSAYSGTAIIGIGEIAQIINTDTTDTNTTEFLSTTIVRNNLGGSITVTPSYSNCDLDGEIVTHNTSITAYETNSVTFGNICNSEQRLCNNGILDGTFTFTGCTVAGATGTFNLSQTTVIQGTNPTITNNCSTSPTGYTSSNEAIATVSGNTITTLSAGTTDITPVGGACGDNTSKVLTVNPLPNSCNSTQPTNATLTIGTPTSQNQTWQSANPSNACYFKCNAGYGSTGTSCVTATTCGQNGAIEITLTNLQTWSCMNLGATEVRNGTLQPTNCGGTSTTNCNAGLTWLGNYYQRGRNEPVNTTSTVSTYNGTFTGLLGHNNFVLGESSYGDWWQNEAGSTTPTRWTGTNPQGPCSIGRHVPSQTDWQTACNTILGTTCTNGMAYNSLIATKLRLPFAGYRRWSNGYYNTQSSNAVYWSSSPYSSSSCYLYFIASGINPAGNIYRGSGFSVRCIKN